MGAEYKIRITSTAELSALKETESRLMKQVTIARTLGQDYSKAAKELEAVQKRLGDFGGGSKLKEALSSGLSRIPVLGELSSLVGGGAAAGIGAVAKFAADSIKEFSQAEDAVAGLDAALAQSGQLTDENREKMQELAGQLQDTTAIADEKWTAVIAKLVQFGSKTDDIKKDTDAVKNLAGIMGGDLESAAMMVARAMQGNFIAFSRLGIQIDENLPQTQKLAKLYEELANRGAGQLEARAKTLSGQWATLKNNTSDLFEAFGRGIAKTGVMQFVLYGLGQTTAGIAKLFGGTVPMVEGLANAAKASKQSFEEGSAGAGKFAEKLKAIEDNAKNADTQIGNLLSDIERTKSEDQQYHDAAKTLELAKLNDKEKRGGISPIAAAKERADIEKKYIDLSLATEQKAIEASIAIRKKAMADRRADVLQADSGIQRAKTDLQKAQEWAEGREGYLRASHRQQEIEQELYGSSQTKERRLLLNRNLGAAMSEADRLKKFSGEDAPPGVMSVEEAQAALKSREDQKAKLVGMRFDKDTIDEREIESLNHSRGVAVGKSYLQKSAADISGKTDVYTEMKKAEDERKKDERERAEKLFESHGLKGAVIDTKPAEALIKDIGNGLVGNTEGLVGALQVLKKQVSALDKQVNDLRIK